MNNKDFIFKKSDDGIEFVGDFEEYYKHESDPWNQLDNEHGRNRKWLLLDYLKDFTPKPRTILDVGCGLGHMVMLLQELIAPTRGVDISETCVDRARKLFPLGNFGVCDIRQSFPSGKFDIVILNHILWYILPELSKVITESVKHLNANGNLLIVHHFLREQKYGKEIIDNFHGLLNYLETKHMDKLKFDEFKFNNSGEALISLRRIDG